MQFLAWFEHFVAFPSMQDVRGEAHLFMHMAPATKRKPSIALPTAGW